MPTLLAYALLFTAVGAGFIFSHLLIGKLVRPRRPDAEKLTVYECGEPTIGSSWVQFDLRFYVVALLFVIFDVEMAFFFPWAVVFGKSNHMAKADLPVEERLQVADELMPGDSWLLMREQRVLGQEPLRQREFRESVNEHIGPLRTPSARERNPVPDLKQGAPLYKQPVTNGTVAERARDAAEAYSWMSFLDILVFFGVLLVGFAYLWRRGDLDWVRSIAAQRQVIGDQSPVSRQQPEEAVAAH